MRFTKLLDSLMTGLRNQGLRHGRFAARRWWAVGGCGLVALAAAGAMQAGSSAASGEEGEWVTLEPQTQQQPLVVQGTVAPSQTVDVLAQTEGTVVKLLARPGEVVAAGQPLVEIDARDVRSQLAEAEAALLRGENEMAALREHGGSTELRAALRRRSVQQAAAAAARRRMAEARELYRAGIIARTELESAESEHLSANDQLLSADDEVKAARGKSSPGMVKAAELELEAKRSRLEQLSAKARQLTVTAPVAGVLMPPPSDKGGEDGKTLREGGPVAAHDVLFSVGALDQPLVRVVVGEMDIGKLHVGQAAQVQPLSRPDARFAAVVNSISALARRGGGRGMGGGTQAEFDVTLRITGAPPANGPDADRVDMKAFAPAPDPAKSTGPAAAEVQEKEDDGEPQQADEGSAVAAASEPSKLHFGTTAEVTIELPFDEAVVSVPLSAIRWDAGGQARAYVRPAGGGRGEWRALEIRQVGPDRAAVPSGVEAGEQAWTGRDAAARSGSSRLAWLRGLFSVGAEEEHDE